MLYTSYLTYLNFSQQHSILNYYRHLLYLILRNNNYIETIFETIFEALVPDDRHHPALEILLSFSSEINYNSNLNLSYCNGKSWFSQGLVETRVLEGD